MGDAPKCIRNLLGEGHKATETIKVTYGGRTYLLDMCGDHARQFDDTLWSWLRVAREESDSVTFTGGPAMSDRLREAPAVIPQLPDKFLEPEPEPEVVTRTQLEIIKLRWTLTEHAKERIDERGPIFGFSMDDAFVAAEKPERTHRDRNGGTGLMVHWRGNVKVVVDTYARTIITVGGKDQQLERVPA